MEIEDFKTFILNETVLRKSHLVPVDEGDSNVVEFIRYYQDGRLGNIERAPYGEEINITVALCSITENDLWENVITSLKEKSWTPASLVLWSLYVQDRRTAVPFTVTLAGTLYRDDDFMEWIPIVRYRPRYFLKTATEVQSMKHSSSLHTAKARTILISKIVVTKT